MSPNKENYLKNIFELQHSSQKVTNKRLAEMMQVSAPSVTEMLVPLAKDDLIEHTPYNQIFLTKNGQALAKDLVKKHRLWEVFLVNKLHYDIDQVHSAADDLEHATDTQLAQALNQYLQYPQKCPHGGIIPGNGQGQSDDDDLLLSNITENTTIKIVRIFDNRDFLSYFHSLGLKLNQVLTVVKRSNFDHSLLLETKEHQKISVSKELTHYIFVEKI
ncbi:metal-dependent transcriptional regulator [Bombilactobacillus thymidiniphilus]|uniref:Manganese transport regulator n=1 Tax=Bombilactobacillus thymidiniphilus TaxID=2923363 RepID=A0ABY4PBM1_9LACO|nr:metal-dependent transcriptional regulator [Bombilactobacillus thymidiniphilus]UQS83173.1 metal-dependent transcriptional regulator [Bombilactobacillus thymidiniphilus]